LSSAQYNALRILRGHGGGPLACGVIAEQMVTREPDISRLLCRMETSGLITRERDNADRRVVQISLTHEGRQCLDALDTPLRDLHRAQFRHMCAHDIETLNTLLSRMQEPHPARVNG
jgi:DNA-binding MarR family transcriptional regulator